MRLWQLAAVLALVGAALAGLGYWYWSRGPASPGEMVAYLPDKNATLLYIDVDAIRRSGILNMIAGSKAAEELEYKDFVTQTHFDYRHDLDAIASTFANDQIFFVLKGHFDWSALRGFVQQKGGTCHGKFCAVDGSRPGRRISFYELKSNLMALAIGPDDMAAYQVTRNASHINPFAPSDPVWMLVPAPVLRDASSLPTGTKAFALTLAKAERIVFSIGPDGDHLQLSVNVTCTNPEAASNLLVELESTTSLLRKWIAKSNQQPNPGDLSGVLTSGSFRRDDRRVVGQWPLQRAFVDAIAGGTY